jgi:hypothetical protein
MWYSPQIGVILGISTIFVNANVKGHPLGDSVMDEKPPGGGELMA